MTMMATSKPDTKLLAEVHVAGPIESEEIETAKVAGGDVVVRATLTQRCLRCDAVLAVCGSASGATWKVGTRIGVIYDKGKTRAYVLDRAGLGEGEENCAGRIGT